MKNALTIDVEDYFQVSNFASFIDSEKWDLFPSRVVQNTNALLDLFDVCNVKATFFTLGWVAERYPDLVRRIHKSGHEVASHGYGHQLIYEIGKERFQEDIRRSKKILEDICGEKILGYRAPSYSIISESTWALDILIEEGFLYDSSIFPTHHPRYGIPDAPKEHHTINREKGTIEEFPPSVLPIGSWNIPISGGGYFRLFPYAFTRWGVRQLHKKNQTFIFYLHPWEIDPKQPRMSEASSLSKFRHYLNLGSTAHRLKKLITDFHFSPMRDFLFGGLPAR